MSTQTTIDSDEFQEFAQGFIDAVTKVATRQREAALKAAQGYSESVRAAPHDAKWQEAVQGAFADHWKTTTATVASGRSEVEAAYGTYVTGVSKALARAISGGTLHPSLLAAVSAQLCQASQVAASWGVGLEQRDDKSASSDKVSGKGSGAAS